METSAAASARELAPLIRAHRDGTEADRRLAKPIVEGLIDTRLTRIAIAKELGGLELPAHEALEVYEVLAAAEASVAWIVWNNSLPCFLARFLDAAARAELFGDPSWLYAISTRPTGTASPDGGGYRIRGRWSLVSGCELAEWIALLCVVVDGGAPRTLPSGVPETRFAFLRRGAFGVPDTWHVGGLRGTGSHDVTVEDACAPRAHTFSPADAPTLDRPIGRMPVICTMAAGFAAQTLGLAQSSLDTLVALAKTKPAVDGRTALRDQPALQALIPLQAAALEAARSHLQRRTRELWRAAEAGGGALLEPITALWPAAHHAVSTAKETLERCYAAAGTTALYTHCPLERAHRDLHAMLRHVVAQTSWVEDAGKVTLGLPPTQPLYAV